MHSYLWWVAITPIGWRTCSEPSRGAEEAFCVINRLQGGYHEEDMLMQSHGQATVWSSQVGVGRASAGEGWRLQLRRWWAARRAARRHATLAAFEGCWDPQREAFRPLRADAAPEVAAARGTLSMATMLYGFTR